MQQIAAAKTPGYAELQQTKGHRKHFPETSYDDFGVLMVTTSPGRRNQLAKAIDKKIINSILKAALKLILNLLTAAVQLKMKPFFTLKKRLMILKCMTLLVKHIKNLNLK